MGEGANARVGLILADEASIEEMCRAIDERRAPIGLAKGLDLKCSAPREY